MTRERAKEWLPLMVAYANGKQIQYRPLSNPDHEWRDTETPQWSEFTEYRIKPEPKLRPWKREEVPVGALIRSNTALVGCQYPRVILGVTSRGTVQFPGDDNVIRSDDLQECFDLREHSIDGGKTWLPCGVMEDSK